MYTNIGLGIVQMHVHAQDNNNERKAQSWVIFETGANVVRDRDLSRIKSSRFEIEPIEIRIYLLYIMDSQVFREVCIGKNKI